MAEISGQYGVLRLLSKLGKSVQSFPVDSEVLTFGRDQSCDVRMYFTFVSPLHAKLVFEDGKAFLSVMGKQGAVVDGNVVLPSSGGEPCIMMLKDDSEFAIHNKTFRFEYPSKEFRVTFLATPPPKSRKSLRMSMINAARIMTPNTRITPSSPSLEMLQTPVKPYADIKNSAERDLEIILAEGDDVVVSKQGNDLVVLESLVHPPVQSSGGSANQDAGDEDQENVDHQERPIQSPPERPRTPRAQISLHKAVLVRNSHLAIIERNDEEEVIEALSPEREVAKSSQSLSEDGSDLSNLSGDSEHSGEGPLDTATGESDSEDDDVGTEEEEEAREQSSPRRSLGLRASIEAIGKVFISPFSGRWSSGEAISKVDGDQEGEDAPPSSDSGDADEDEARNERDSKSDPLASDPQVLPSANFSVPRDPFLPPQASPLHPSLSFSASGEIVNRDGSVLETKPITYRSRFSSFGLPDYILDSAANEEDEEQTYAPDEHENAAASAASNDQKSFGDNGPTLSGQTPAPVPQTPNLDSLRKQVRYFQLDNAKRASRLSFGASPMPRIAKTSVVGPNTSTLKRGPLDAYASEHITKVDTKIKLGYPDGMSSDSSKYGHIDGSTLTRGDSESVSDTRSSSPQRSRFSFIGAPNRPPPPKTPSYTGFRNLFAAPPLSPSTPALNGLRQLFRSGEPQNQPSATPNFSGVGDMFCVPEDENDERSDAETEENNADGGNSLILRQGDSAKITSVAIGNAVSRRQYTTPEPLLTAVPKRDTRSTRRTTPAGSNNDVLGNASTAKEAEQGPDLPVVVSDSIAAPRATRSRRVRATTDSSGIIDSKTSIRSSRASSKSSSRIPTSTVSRPKREKNKFTDAEEPQIKTEDESDGHGEESISLPRAMRKATVSTPGDEASTKPRSTNRKAKPTPSSVRATNIPVTATSSRRTRASPTEAAKVAISNQGDDSDAEADISSANSRRPAPTKTRDTSSGSRVQRSTRKVQDRSLASNPQEPKRLGASEDDERTRPKTSTAIAPRQASRKAPARGSKLTSGKKQSPVAETEGMDGPDKENAPGSVASSEEEDEEPVKPIRTTRKTPARKVVTKSKDSSVTPTNEAAPPARALRTRSTKK